MELSIDRGRPNAHRNPWAAGRRPGHARGRLIPSVAERLQPTIPFRSYVEPLCLETPLPQTARASRLTRTRVEFSRGMLTAAQKGRFRSAERTEVHLITTIRFDELAFCPSMRTSGVGKEVRHAGKTPSIEPQPRSSQVSS